MRKPGRPANATSNDAPLYTLDVSLLSGPIPDAFARKNPVVARTIEIRGNQTLAHLHAAIFKAFDREEDHLYEFQIGGRRPMDPRARRYGASYPDPFGFGKDEPVHSAARTKLDALGLDVQEAFVYWFDFGDDWWHKVAVVKIAESAPRGRYPRVTKRVGESPPQYVDSDEE